MDQAEITAQNIVGADYWDAPVKELARAYLALKSARPEVGEWIAVSTRKPERGTTVLVLWQKGELSVADISDRNDDERGFFIGGQFWYWDNEHQANNVTHWRHLPPPPQPQRDAAQEKE